MIICKACELKQEPTPKCRRCGKGLFPQDKWPRGKQEATMVDGLDFTVLPEPKPIVAARVHAIIPLAELEREMIERALRLFPVDTAAAKLGIGRTTLYRYIRTHKLVPLRHCKA